MIPSLLILIAVGMLGAAALPASRTVTERLHQSIVLPVVVALGVGVVWALVRGPAGEVSAVVGAVQRGLLVVTAGLGVAGLVLPMRRQAALGRAAGVAALVVGVLAASHVLHCEMAVRGTAVGTGGVGGKMGAMGLQTAACLVAAGVVGLIPVALVCGAMGWSRAMGRVRPAVAGAVVARVALTVGAVALMPGAWEAVSGRPGWGAARGGLLAAVVLAVAVAMYGGRRVSGVTGNRLLLGAWVAAMVGEGVGLWLLVRSGVPV